MKLTFIKNALTSKAGRQVLKLQKHSPTLLFVAGTVGVVGAAVLAARATLKLDEVLLEGQENLDLANSTVSKNYSDEDRTKDKVIIYTKMAMKIGVLYAPAVALGVASIAALTGAHVVLNRRNVALTAAYAALDKGFRQYRERVIKAVGSDKEREFRYDLEDCEIVEETDEGPVVKTVKKIKNGGSPYSRLFDEINSNSWSAEHSYNQLFLRCQQNYANDLLRSRGHVFLNEVYDMLGLARSREGAVVGWVLDGGNSDNFIDFGVFEGDAWEAMRFVRGDENSIWLDFNVDGVIYDKL